MANSSCLLFPSYIEGMPLTLARAVQIGIPVLASDIEPVAEMAGTRDGLLKPGDVEEWRCAINNFLCTRAVTLNIPSSRVPTLKKMADEDEAIYKEVLRMQSQGKKS